MAVYTSKFGSLAILGLSPASQSDYDDIFDPGALSYAAGSF
jgi:hypothetical protein